MAIYVAVITGRRRWFVAAIVLGIAAFGTVSRTAVVSLLAIGIVYLILRPAQTFRFWPLVLPGLIAVHIAMPGVLGSMYKGIFPQKGLIAQEAGGAVGSSRTASFGPGMHEVGLRPLLGGGYGSRIPTGPNANSFIVDDQWLSTAMETGIAGVAVWLWVFARFIRLMFRCGAEGPDPTRLALRRRSGHRDRLRGRHGDLRLVLVHPGNARALHPARDRVRRTDGEGRRGGAPWSRSSVIP